jgi:hypothetical protein
MKGPEIDAIQIATIAGGTASAVAALANMLLVLFVYRQVTMQRDFFVQQSQRDARAKISEAWQRHAADLGFHPVVAQRLWSTEKFWPGIKPEQIELIGAYIYTLNTLHYEYRFAEEGLHERDSFLSTLKYYVGTIDDERELTCLLQMAEQVGFGERFVGAVRDTVLARCAEIRREVAR